MTSAKWECQRCKKKQRHLYYCSECWRMVCERCFDSFVGTCTDCTIRLSELTSEGKYTRKPLGQDSNVSEEANINAKCRKCNIDLITTLDGIICCPKCGLVAGRLHLKETKVHKLDAHAEDGDLEENYEAEDQRWEDSGYPEMSEENAPEGYEDITHPEGEGDYDAQ